ncbi:diguanylate cyclase, partial [Massilia aurea]
MKPVRDTTSVLLGAEPTLRRMLNYWIATALLYLAAIVLMACQVAAGHTPRDLALLLGATAAAGTLASYALIRFSAALGLAPGVLATLQSLFAIGCGMAGYAIAGPVRAALLCMTVV